MESLHLELPDRSIYLPFMSGWRFAMGLKPLAIENWIEIDQDLPDQLSLKRSLLADQHESVFVSLPESQMAQRECLELLLTHLCDRYPQYYQINSETILNLITKEQWHISDFAQNPLDLAARLVQEDLCLMQSDSTQYRLVAASVCFPSRWSLPEKLGQPLAEIHQPVPGYSEQLRRPVDQMFDRLKTEYSAYRFNWGIVDSPDLFLPPSKEQLSKSQIDCEITDANAGEYLWIRVERQTLRRLPLTQAILFTIRTYIYPLHTLTHDVTVVQRLAEAIQQIPQSTLQYKNLLPFRSPLLNYLAEKAIASTQPSYPSDSSRSI